MSVNVGRSGFRRLALLGVTLGLVACSAASDSDENVGTSSAALCANTSVTANPGGPADVGATVTLTASGSSCAVGETPEYLFYYKRENTSDPYALLRGYSTTPSVGWNTGGLPSGRYQFVVYTRAVGSTASFQQVTYFTYYLKNVCSTGSLAVTSGAPVTLTGSASCTGAATPEFHYYYKRQELPTWNEIGAFTPGSTSWNTSALTSGTYQLMALIRATGNASSSEGAAYATFLVGNTCSSATLSASPTSPQQPGANITLTAAASCGGSPVQYSFYYRSPTDLTWQLLQAYGASTTAPWNTTGLTPGVYSLLTQARVSGNTSAAEANGYASFTLGATALGLSAGAAHSCVLLNSGLKCFGRQVFGAATGQYSYDRGLEAADMADSLPAVNVGTGRTVRALARGSYHACAILDNDTVKCWGQNSGGALGLGDMNHRSAGANELGDALPTVNLGTGRTAKQITAGGGFSCAILDNNTVKCWGGNTYGGLGLGDQVARGDNAGEMGDSLPTVNLGTGRTATAIAAGVGHVCATLDNGSLKCWGLNNFGQLGLGDLNWRGDNASEMGDNLPAVDLGTGHTAKAVALGVYHTCAILENDSLKCWGQGSLGALGSGDTASRGDGPGEMGDVLPTVSVGSGRTVKSVALAGGHTCAVLDNDSLKCWGWNADGQLGLGDLANRGDSAGEMGDALAPVSLGTGRTARKVTAGYVNSCAELDTGAVKCWGASYTGMLGIGQSNRRGASSSDMGDGLPSFSLGSAATVASFGSGHGYHFGCALLSNSTVKCWGANSYGQLGIDRSSNVGDEPTDMGTALKYVSLGTGAVVAAVATGEHHSCALLADGRVKCFGANLNGSSGVGDTKRHDGRPAFMGDNLPAVDFGSGHTAKKISSGSAHACAILDDDTVKCWGQNTYGQLGLGDASDRGDEPSDMGSALPVVSLGTGRKAVSLSLGARHSCAVLDNGSLKCWGWNSYGQLGIGATTDRGAVSGQMGDSLPAVNVGTGRTVVSVSAGYFNTCATLDNNTVKCWGNNDYGQLGAGDKVHRGLKAIEMGDNLPVVNFGTGRSASAVGVGTAHACALLDNQTVKCWGYNSYGKLGYGDAANRGDAPGEMGDSLAAVDFGAGQGVGALGVGWDHNCVVISGGGSVRCWGNGDQGALGYGDNVTRGDGAGEMGSNLGSVNLGEP